MQLDKRKIRGRFSLASVSYEDVAVIQKESARILVSALQDNFPDFYPNSILDLGTGTGYIAELLLPSFPCSNYTLNDISPDMLNIAKRKFDSLSQFKFHLGDMESEDFIFHELITANFSLQWIHQLKDYLRKLFLNSHIVAFSCLLQGTFQEWDDILQTYQLASPSPLYPSQEELEQFLLSLEPSRYSFNIKDFTLPFTNLKEFLKYVQKLGASTGRQEIPFNILKNLIQTHNQNICITYKVFFGILKRI